MFENRIGTILLLSAANFLAGSLMFSYWLGKLLRKDIRKVGDGNPGAFNLIKSAGLRIGIAGVILDFMKGYLPVALMMHFLGLHGADLVPVAIAPVLGHMFSPFMRFKGGRAMAVTFGVWCAATSFEIGLVYALLLAMSSVLAHFVIRGRSTTSSGDALMAVVGFTLLLPYMLLRGTEAFGVPMLVLWALNWILFLVVNRGRLLSLLRGKAGADARPDAGPDAGPDGKGK